MKNKISDGHARADRRADETQVDHPREEAQATRGTDRCDARL